MTKYKTINGWTKASMRQHVVDNFKGQSINNHGICLYRGPEGTKCALGLFIPDELYQKDMELKIGAALLYPDSIYFVPELTVVVPLEPEGLYVFQRTHDLSAPSETLEVLLRFIDNQVEDGND